MTQKAFIGILFLFLTTLLISSWQTTGFREDSHATHNCPFKHSVADTNLNHLFPRISERKFDSLFMMNLSFLSDGFDFPVGKPDAANYYRALKFKQQKHLGEDWNSKKGGNTDLGDPVYAASNGLVTFSEDVCCGWGKVIRVAHFLPNHSKYRYLETVYAHLDQIDVQVGQFIQRGQQIGTIGTANGRYTAHLHFEMRDFVNMSLGPGYSDDFYGYTDPTEFITSYRPKK
ncbi:MAG: M23 family metallopeptidase [Bacteroidota bacterium]